MVIERGVTSVFTADEALTEMQKKQYSFDFIDED
jgi:hypothetical protein